MLPKLSILMPCLVQRDSTALIAELTRQLIEAEGRAELLVETDDGTLSSGIKRQRLLNRSRGEYVCYVDDDDWVYPDYTTALLRGCDSGASVVTFNLSLRWLRSDRRELWKYRLNAEDNRFTGVMGANHLCAWRRDIATLVGWCPYLGYGDDQLWYKPLCLAASALGLTEYRTNLLLYEYRFSWDTTVNQNRERIHFSRDYAHGGLRCFWHHDKIVVESGNRRSPFGSIGVINRRGEDVLVEQSALKELGTISLRS